MCNSSKYQLTMACNVHYPMTGDYIVNERVYLYIVQFNTVYITIYNVIPYYARINTHTQTHTHTHTRTHIYIYIYSK